MNIKRPPCHVCDGRETTESLVVLQASGSTRRVPLCPAHFTVAESAWREVERTRTPPVTVGMPAVRIGVTPYERSP